MPPGIFESRSPKETQKFGATLARKLKKMPVLVLLDGPLGAGKTQFAQGLIHAFLGKTAPVLSPTYSIANAYKKGKKSLFHVDLYRIQSADDLESVGFWDFFEGPNAVIVEWAEKLPDIWPRDILHFRVKIEMGPGDSRKISISES